LAIRIERSDRPWPICYSLDKTDHVDISRLYSTPRPPHWAGHRPRMYLGGWFV